MNANHNMTATEDRVRAIAYSLWLEEGQPEGRAESHWLKAMELATEAQAPMARPVKRKTPAAAATKAAPRKRS